VKDSDRRRKTVVVSGLMPVHGVSDGTLFWDFCSNNLNLKPYVDDKRVGRVGKGAPQKLLVPLLSEHSAAEVLRCAKELRLSADDDVKKVYINPDLSPEDAKAAYEKRVARRLAKTSRQVTDDPGPAIWLSINLLLHKLCHVCCLMSEVCVINSLSFIIFCIIILT